MWVRITDDLVVNPDDIVWIEKTFVPTTTHQNPSCIIHLRNKEYIPVEETVDYVMSKVAAV